jgi:hypothetical protein
MVLRGQVFMFDVVLAFLVLLLIFSSFLQTIFLANGTMGESYENFLREKKILDASEKLIAVELAEYSENTLKHHILSLEKIKKFGAQEPEEMKRNLLLSDYNVSLSIKADKELLKVGDNLDGTVVKRIALCGGEVCIIEIRAK